MKMSEKKKVKLEASMEVGYVQKIHSKIIT
jgi:hypothetical protein